MSTVKSCKHHFNFFLLDNFQVLGSCVPDAVGPVAMVTELGDPLDTVRLLQLSWEDRLRVRTTLVVSVKTSNAILKVYVITNVYR
jgi:hypothetical protein